MKLRFRHAAVIAGTTLCTATLRFGVGHSPRTAGFLMLALLASLSGCGQQPRQSRTADSSTYHSPAASIVVFAALPLEPAFTRLAGEFRTENPGTTVDFDFATSADLANKLTRGASADVFAAADSAQMDTVVKAGLTSSEPVNFASNTLAIVTAPGDPKRIRSFADLARPELRVAVCQASAPCGVGVQRIEDNTGVHLHPVSEDPTSSAVLARVAAKEADAGLVYRNDAQAAGRMIDTVAFPESADAVNAYPIAVLKKAVQSALAQKFVDLVTGSTGQRVLSEAGFAGP